RRHARPGAGLGRLLPRTRRRPPAHRRRADRPARRCRREDHRVRRAARAPRGRRHARLLARSRRDGRAPRRAPRHQLARLRLAARASRPPAARHAPRARPGARRGARRGAPQADAAHLGVERARRRHRQLPVGAQRGRPRERGALRHPRRATHLRRRRDVHGGGFDHHLLALRARRARAGHELRRQLRLPRRLGAAGAALARDRGHLPAAQRHREPRREDRGSRPEAPRGRRRAAPRDHVVRHRRREDGAGAAHRPRKAQRQGHQVGAEAGRPAAQPDRTAARGDHRADGRHLPLPARAERRRDHPRRVRARRATGGREVRHRGMGAPSPVKTSARHARRRTVVGISLAVLLVAATLVSAIVGQFGVSAQEVVLSVLHSTWIPNPWFANPWPPIDPTADAALWVIRFPRIVMAMAVGAALAVAGAVMQAVFGNPLAEPGVVGVSSGAALGAAIAIVTGLFAFGEWTIALLAFAGGLGATLLVYGVSRAGGRTEVVTLLLTGIAVNAFGGAGLAFLLFMAGSAGREQIVFWQLGSLSGSLWRESLLVLVVAVLGVIVAML